MTVQIVEVSGQKLAMLPIEDYQRLVDIAEDKHDVIAAEMAEQRRTAGEEYLPAEVLDRIMNGESALRVWRKHRGMTLEQLAERTGARKSMLSTIENGKAQGKPSLWRALAEVLDVSTDDILPLN
ncbi:XRE family transcriptional regulator [Sphingobium algorifonticola]|uniref:XRE family transcriptional regulator n=2 Tax=Sphingobium algorifonticola TaxID=2008318 RepID=A0A437J8M6_9SPHN|nr:XRE family transcriptional regulator [Sphingobium algorifonticola]